MDQMISLMLFIPMLGIFVYFLFVSLFTIVYLIYFIFRTNYFVLMFLVMVMVPVRGFIVADRMGLRVVWTRLLIMIVMMMILMVLIRALMKFIIIVILIM